MLKLAHDVDVSADAVGDDPEAARVDLDELCRLAVQEMLATALMAERRAYLDAHVEERDVTGKRQVVGNGFSAEREVVTGAGPVTVTAPRVDDRREGCQFSSQILPPYMRRSPKVTEVLPVLICGAINGGLRPGVGWVLQI